MVSNFEFLKKDFPVLANFGELAEKYCYSDSNSFLRHMNIVLHSRESQKVIITLLKEYFSQDTVRE